MSREAGAGSGEAAARGRREVSFAAQEEAAAAGPNAMENWEIAETVGTEEEASLVAGFLEAQGIASQVESLLFHQEPATFGKLSEVRILVHADDVARARILIEERESGAVSPSDAADDAAGDSGV